MPLPQHHDRFTFAVRSVLGRYVSARKFEALRLELIRAGVIARDEGHAPYDEEEIRRFQMCMNDRYIVGAGTTVREALTMLSSQAVRKPDIFLLDLYYGPETDPSQRAEIAQAHEELLKSQARFRSLLNQVHQSPTGGFSLADEVKRTHP